MRLKLTAEFLEPDIKGVLGLKVDNARAVVKKLTELCKKDPEKFSSTFYYIPIDMWCKTNIIDMQSCIKNFIPEIRESDKWKLNLRIRGINLNEKELITKLTDPIDRALVDLKNPDKIIQVEILGDKSGISLLKPNEILNTTQFK